MFRTIWFQKHIAEIVKNFANEHKMTVNMAVNTLISMAEEKKNEQKRRDR